MSGRWISAKWSCGIVRPAPFGRGAQPVSTRKAGNTARIHFAVVISFLPDFLILHLPFDAKSKPFSSSVGMLPEERRDVIFVRIRFGKSRHPLGTNLAHHPFQVGMNRNPCPGRLL